MRRLLAVLLLVLPAVALAGRNGTGTYTLPPSGATGWTNPVATGTTISADWANSTLNDIAQALTDSLDRNGTIGMAQPLKLVAGTQANPGLTFTLEQTSGLYRIGQYDLGLSVNGTKALEFTPSLVTIPLPVSLSSSLTLGSGALTVGGSTTMAGASFSGAVSISGGDLSLNKTGTQYVNKTGGDLSLTTTGVYGVYMRTAGLDRWAVTYNGTLQAFNNARINGLLTPLALSEPATKGYVDGGVAFTGKSTAPSTGGGDPAGTLVTKDYVDGRIMDSRSAVNNIGVGFTNGMALFSIVFGSAGKVHFSGVLYLSTPAYAQLQCTPTVNLSYQYLTVDGGTSQSSTWTTFPVATSGAVLTNALTITLPSAPTGQAVFHFDGAFMSGGSAGVLNCRIVQGGGTLAGAVAAGSHYDWGVDN